MKPKIVCYSTDCIHFDDEGKCKSNRIVFKFYGCEYECETYKKTDTVKED